MLRSLHTTIDDAIDAAGLPLLGVVPEDPDVPYYLNRGLVLRDRTTTPPGPMKTLPETHHGAENPADEDMI